MVTVHLLPRPLPAMQLTIQMCDTDMVPNLLLMFLLFPLLGCHLTVMDNAQDKCIMCTCYTSVHFYACAHQFVFLE